MLVLSHHGVLFIFVLLCSIWKADATTDADLCRWSLSISLCALAAPLALAAIYLFLFHKRGHLDALTSSRSESSNEMVKQALFAGSRSVLPQSLPNVLPVPLPDWGYFNVKLFGATADGADDTSAFAAALDAAGKCGGGTVFVPAGTYTIRGTLKLPKAVTLRGSNEYPFCEWGSPGGESVGATLLAYAGQGDEKAEPFILMNQAAGVLGLSIFYPAQSSDKAPVPFPPCIRGLGNNNTVKNCLLVNPFFGIDFATNPSGRHLVEGVYGQPLSVGIRVDQCYDIGRIKHIHFWGFWAKHTTPVGAWIKQNATTIDLQRTDWEIVDDVFSYGHKVGLRLGRSSHGASNGQFSNINFDDVDVGVDAVDTQPPACVFSNLNIANAAQGGGSVRVAIRSAGSGQPQVTVRGGSFWGKLEAAVEWGSEGVLRLSDSSVHSWARARPAVSVTCGAAVLVANSFKPAVGQALHVGPAAGRVVVACNDFAGNSVVIDNADTVATGNHA